MFPWGTSGVLLPITAWLEWKKACLFCQGLLNQVDLNLWGHTAGTSGGDWKVINGRLWGGVMMRQKLRQCVLFYTLTDDMRQRSSRSQTHLDVVGGKSSLRHLEAKRCPILTGSCVNKSIFYSFEPLQRQRNLSCQPQSKSWHWSLNVDVSTYKRFKRYFQVQILTGLVRALLLQGLITFMID